jgi:hypothetical protein
MKIKLVLCWIFAHFFIISISLAENFTNITQPNNSVFSSNSEPILILFFVILLVAMMLVPVLYDIRRAYGLEQQRLEMFSCNNEVNLPQASRVELCKIYKTEPKGITGLSRGLFASGIIIILGTILFYGTIKYGFNQETSNIASILGGTLSTIVGFYFGAKSTSETTGSPNQSSNKSSEVTDEKKKEVGE